jgi:hypothetical protein
VKKPILFLLGVLAFLVYDHYRAFDNTDDAATRTRSGMRLWIDHGTGCEYLSPGLFGGLNPRLDKQGNQICQPPSTKPSTED